MGSASDPLMKLRPVTFRYRSDPSILQYGLIAEQVAKVMPSLAVFGKDGRPDGVSYQNLPVLLLNELQAQQRQDKKQQRRIVRQRAQNGALKAQNSRQQAQIDWLLRKVRGR